MINLNCYDGQILEVKRSVLKELVAKEYDMSLEEFLVEYTQDDAEYIKVLIEDLNGVKIVEVNDKYNLLKVWVIKRYNNGNYYIQQKIAGKIQGGFIRTTKRHLRDIGILFNKGIFN